MTARNASEPYKLLAYDEEKSNASRTKGCLIKVMDFLKSSVDYVKSTLEIMFVIGLNSRMHSWVGHVPKTEFSSSLRQWQTVSGKFGRPFKHTASNSLLIIGL